MLQIQTNVKSRSRKQRNSCLCQTMNLTILQLNLTTKNIKQSSKLQINFNPSNPLLTNKTQSVSTTSAQATKPQLFIIIHPTQNKPSVSNKVTSSVFLPSKQTDSCQNYHNRLILIIPSKSRKQIQLLLLMKNSHRLSLIIIIPLKLVSAKKSVLG